MTCTEVRKRLDGYVDGDLAEEEFQEVEHHLSACPECREEEKALRTLIARAAALPREVEPARDLWPGIADRIAQRIEPSTRREKTGGILLPFPGIWRSFGGRVALAAAATVVLAITGSLLWAPRPSSTGPSAPTRTDVIPGRTDVGGVRTVRAGAGLAGLESAELEYSRATAELMKALDARRDSLPATTLATVETNLKVIDDALQQIREALGKDPGNPGLARMLRATYRKKLDVLKQVTRQKA